MYLSLDTQHILVMVINYPKKSVTKMRIWKSRRRARNQFFLSAQLLSCAGQLMNQLKRTQSYSTQMSTAEQYIYRVWISCVKQGLRSLTLSKVTYTQAYKSSRSQSPRDHSLARTTRPLVKNTKRANSVVTQ